ncbi:alanine/glycine:cation symporter family protein [Limimaricola hongkongensis]|uniref:Putative amino acid carrier protein (Sodium/alanine symporter) n=1 Tax=Limimaricola hongkongensis DSM 17492 TaxID=1122180 RepID=A0A017HGH9_9RHOB|nr:alanine/glycine:cation symporter family protein [Limimaricola hongkongensis]EYD73420.1 putative amino acid carrier protein (sodium/alanine symporter) [Limimaricola hongkongensis DSM 17492]
MTQLQTIFGWIGDATWGWALIPFLVVLGGAFTLISGFVQLRFFGRMWGVLSDGGDRDGGVSSREALLVSIGGRVGGGNIAGVAVAITLGGPGAVFWMWVVALIGMATSLFECALAQLYKRTEPDGTYRGGPAQYIIHGLGERFNWLAILYAVCLLASFGLGFSAFQGNTVAVAANDSLGLDPIWVGAGLALVTAVIVFGGIKRIAKVSDVVIPVMALGYIVLALAVIILNITEVPQVLWTIVANALGFEEAVGGGVGAAVAQGMRRGLFSNEAGLGSAPNVAAAAAVPHPISQGIVQSLSVFIDTMIICSCTALVILLGDVYVPGSEDVNGVALTQQSLVGHLGEWAQYFLTGAVLLFAFSSIIYNYYLGETAVSVLSGSWIARLALRIAVPVVVFLGAAAPGATAVFFFSDPLMGLLALVNLLALAMLFPVGLRLLADYRRQLRAGAVEPVLEIDDYADLDIDRGAWAVPARTRPLG